MGVVAVLATLIIFWIHTLVVSPINRIHRRLVSLEKKESDEPLKLRAAQELVRLGESVNALGETLRLKQRREAELEEAQHSLSIARDRAIEASRAKSDFLANMSHELRTPMNGVLGMLSLLRDTALNRDQRRCVKVATSSGKTLLTLINDILDFSKIEAGRLELESINFNLVDVVEDSVELLAEQAHGKDLEITCLFGECIPQIVRGDPTRLRQVLTNLLANAVKFTESGEVLVRVERVDTCSERHLYFAVTDTGVGISDAAQERIFDSFTQADGSTTRRYGGSGLGLAISRQLVEHMDGDIGVTSRLDEGSTFWFTARFAASQLKDPDFTPAAELANAKVLVADDSVTCRNQLSSHLQSWGIDNGTAANGEDALAAMKVAAAQGMAFDLAVVDMMMPGTDGLELVRRLKEDPTLAPTKTVLLAPFSGQQDHAERVRAAGADGHVTKPVRSIQLHDAIAVALELKEQQSKEPSQSLEVSTEERAARSSKRILLVEDNEVNQEVAIGMLEKLAYHAEVAANGMEALSALERSTYDLILMDCQMPVLDGYETTMRIRSGEVESARLPIIALTANAMEGDAEKCLAAGMDDYLAKPIDIVHLSQKLGVWLSSVAADIESEAASDDDSVDIAEPDVSSRKESGEGRSKSVLDRAS